MSGDRIYLTSAFDPILHEGRVAFGSQKSAALLLSIGNSWLATQKRSPAQSQSPSEILPVIKKLLAVQEVAHKGHIELITRVGLLEVLLQNQAEALSIIARELSNGAQNA
jgi:predicted transcriptional regulator